MGKRELVGNRQYTDEFKVEAARLGESLGVTTAAKRLGIPDSSLWNWIRLKRDGDFKGMEGGTVEIRIPRHTGLDRCATYDDIVIGLRVVSSNGLISGFSI